MRVAVVGFLFCLSSTASAQPVVSTTDALQIPTHERDANINAGQITTGAHGPATPPAQLTQPSPQTDAPVELSTRQQGRRVGLVQVKGRDRCDAAVGASADTASCSRIVEYQSADLQTHPAPPAAVTVNPDATPAGLVNDIVNGGTGSVVVLPKGDPTSGP